MKTKTYYPAGASRDPRGVTGRECRRPDVRGNEHESGGNARPPRMRREIVSRGDRETATLRDCDMTTSMPDDSRIHTAQRHAHSRALFFDASCAEY